MVNYSNFNIEDFHFVYNTKWKLIKLFHQGRSLVISKFFKQNQDLYKYILYTDWLTDIKLDDNFFKIFKKNIFIY